MLCFVEWTDYYQHWLALVNAHVLLIQKEFGFEMIIYRLYYNYKAFQ